MKLTSLQIYLDGASSTLDLFPESRLKDELARIQETIQQMDVKVHILSEQQISTLEGLRQIEEVSGISDMRSLDHDWRNVGNDFLNAYQKAQKGVKTRKDDSECWSY